MRHICYWRGPARCPKCRAQERAEASEFDAMERSEGTVRDKHGFIIQDAGEPVYTEAR